MYSIGWEWNGEGIFASPQEILLVTKVAEWIIHFLYRLNPFSCTWLKIGKSMIVFIRTDELGLEVAHLTNLWPDDREALFWSICIQSFYIHFIWLCMIFESALMEIFDLFDVIKYLLCLITKSWLIQLQVREVIP